MGHSVAVLGLETLQATGSAFNGQIPFFFRRQDNRNIRRDAFFMNDFVTRGVILRRGKAESRTIGQRKNALNGTFAEGFLAENNCAVIVLKTASHDFGGAGAAEINQHDHRHVFALVTAATRHTHRILRFIAAFSPDNFLISG